MKALIARTTLALAATFGAGAANAIPLIPVITGADMVGIEVEAFYDGLSDTATWINTTVSGSSSPDGEHLSGRASGAGWFLRQQGFTFGNGGGRGMWTFSNVLQAPITSFVVRGLPGLTVFDTVFETEETPGSNLGRPFFTNPDEPSIATASYEDVVSAPDLFSTLRVDFTQGGLAAGSDLQFFIDTDGVVPAPATLLLMGAGLLAASVRRRAA